MVKENIIQVCAGLTHTHVLVQSGNVYSTGENSVGQLGLGDYKDRNTMCMIDPKKFNNEKVVEIFSCFSKSIALTQEGNIYTWGCFEMDHYSNISEIMENRCVPKKIDLNNEIVTLVSVGINHSFVLTKTNKLFSWGAGMDGKLGLGHEENKYEPSLVDSKTYDDKKIQKICCGMRHTMIMTDDGELYFCGEHFLDMQRRETFDRIDQKYFGDEKIIDIKSQFYSLALTESGKVYSWGLNVNGQLGHGDKSHCFLPNLIDPQWFKNEKIKSISGGTHYSFFITQSGKVYACGHNDRSYLIVGHDNEVNVPQEIVYHDCLKDRKILSIDSSSSYYSWSDTNTIHFVILTKSKISNSSKISLFVYGNNTYGQLGLDQTREYKEPVQCCPELFEFDA